MKKSPKDLATLYKIGKKKKGVDNNYYYVIYDKNKKKIWKKETSLFVIYKINISSNIKRWVYNKFPNDWDWVGAGTTVNIQKLNNNIKYPYEEQFIGNPNYKKEMKEYLSKFFIDLKKKKIIIDYKIVSLNGLHKYMDSIK